MDCQAGQVIERVPTLTDEARDGLAETLQQYETSFAKQIEKGIAKLWRINYGESWMITRAEHDELVVCCFKGRNLNIVGQQIIKDAKRAGYLFIRFHTQRPGMGRYMKHCFNFNLRERVYDLEL